ncbi:beta-alanine transporter-like [Dermacentor albipictus]|uniref:beta-alanine transporter-like n=1 Tax=Dermacentor albipictus TaxID=60249 RepID=UPI0031FE08B4
MAAHHDQRATTPLSVPGESAPTKPAPKRLGNQVPYGCDAYQMLHVFDAVIVVYSSGLHYESFRLTAGVMDHWCRRPDSMNNLSVDEWKQLAIPVDERGEHSHCTMRDPPDGGHAARIVPCASWEFDLDQYGNNIVCHWNLVCDRRWLIDVARLVYAAASIATLPVVGALADSVGRKAVLFLTVPVVLISGTASAMPNDFHFFVGVRAVVSASTSALVVPVYGLVYELSPIEKYRNYVVMVAITALMLSPITLFTAQLVKAGWATLQLILMVPTCLLLLLYYIIDESPSWLLETGNVKEAERIALRAASINKVSPEHCRDLMAAQAAEIKARSQEAGNSSGICSPRFRACTITMCYMWAAISYAFDAFVVNDGFPVGETTTALS